MPIHNPPQYRYALFDPWDKEAFAFIKEIGKTKQFPKIIGSPDDKNQFLITLIRTQKALGIPYEEYERRMKYETNQRGNEEKQNKNDWRNMFKDVLKEAKETNTVNTIQLNKKYPPESIDKNIPAWVTYEEDKIVNDFIDELATKKVAFIGSDEEIAEFAMRFILGQLCHDWESTIMMIWEMLGDGNMLEVKKLNEEMKHFDYLQIFA